ncbi:MAG: tetratricopeptide repeat protein, partial [Betaproteobacteria bacterium]|nr:tetratricopeptide repeat protein [Betaproteobacteria bacterium]
MGQPLTFEVSEGASHHGGRRTATGHFSRDWEDEEEMDRLQEQFDAGTVDDNTVIKKVRQLLTKHPDNMELLNFLGSQLWDVGLRDEASSLWETGHKIGASLIPKGFKGEISWYETDNQSFLRVTHGHVLGLAHLGRYRQALALAKKLLHWNPSDNQGVRLLIGDFMMKLGDHNGAMKLFLKGAQHYPTFWYRAALVAFRDGDFVRACTYLRCGIAGNPYVAEGLTGRTLLADHLYWHGSNVSGCDWAIDEYLQSPVNDWKDDEVDFVDWVFNCSDVLRERA